LNTLSLQVAVVVAVVTAAVAVLVVTEPHQAYL
jgi:hypothetical protein